MDLRAASLDNREGLVEAHNGLALAVAGVLGNQQGKLLGAQTSVTSQALDNSNGLIQGDSSLVLQQTAELLNADGQLLAGQHLNSPPAAWTTPRQPDQRWPARRPGKRTGDQPARSAGGQGRRQSDPRQPRQSRSRRIASQANLSLRSGNLDNRGGVLAADRGLNLRAGQVNNGDGGRISSSGQLTASASGLDQQNDGQLFSQGGVSLDLNGGLLDNRGGRINAPASCC
ncbi:hypothetical protein CSV86_013505 [Pseudomonas putida CSV86]|uniref:Uncharacterized protein n=1 Tax=Pseudomonas bharatica CSV86 TaxID=1005395 RepID=A0A7K4EET8_9PSED|nr:hypothetical protein [Pseudomonas bharatica]NNJ16168.1 hypothetical protein [Pseudomonas bharatica CSV86]